MLVESNSMLLFTSGEFHEVDSDRSNFRIVWLVDSFVGECAETFHDLCRFLLCLRLTKSRLDVVCSELAFVSLRCCQKWISSSKRFQCHCFPFSISVWQWKSKFDTVDLSVALFTCSCFSTNCFSDILWNNIFLVCSQNVDLLWKNAESLNQPGFGFIRLCTRQSFIHVKNFQWHERTVVTIFHNPRWTRRFVKKTKKLLVPDVASFHVHFYLLARFCSYSSQYFAFPTEMWGKRAQIDTFAGILFTWIEWRLSLYPIPLFLYKCLASRPLRRPIPADEKQSFIAFCSNIFAVSFTEFRKLHTVTGVCSLTAWNLML